MRKTTLSIFNAENIGKAIKSIQRQTIGFDNIFDDVFNHPQTDNYPPYNLILVKNPDFDKKDYERMEGHGDGMIIEVAVAGFSKNNLDVTIKDNLLTIRPNCCFEEQPKNWSYQHKGIAERTFELKFRLANYVDIEKVKLDNGILRVYLKREIPDETYRSYDIE